MKRILFILYSLSFVLLLTLSCKKGVIEPDLQDENVSNSLDNFDIDSITPTARELLVKWKEVTNAINYDVIVNDTIGLYNIKTSSCLLNHLNPNTRYKISVRAYDKNYLTKTVSKYVKTLTESLNEITALPFGRYEYQKINITHCKVTKDNNYIILGDAFIFDKVYKIVLKTDKNFNILWKYNYEGGSFDYGNRTNGQDIKECNDGGFLIISRQLTLKISKDGTIIYQKKYIETNFDASINNGIEAMNGNFLFVGSQNMMLKYNFETLWTKAKNIYSITDVIQNEERNYFIFGTKLYGDGMDYYNNKYKIALQELDDSGNQLKEIVYNVSDQCYSQFLLDSRDNGFYLLSYSSIYYYGYTLEMCVTKIDNKGDEIWSLHSCPKLNTAVIAKDARVLDDKTLLCICFNQVNQHYYIYEISSEGKIKKTFSAGNMYVPIFVDKDQEGRYVILTQEGYIYKLSKER